MFAGVTQLTLDPKNRLSIPSRYREELLGLFEGKVIITLESPQCLLLYPEKNWVIVRDKIQNLTTGAHPLVKSYQRLVLGYAETIEVDKSGRILLPGGVKNLAQLDREVVLVGLGNRFELWDKTKWDNETMRALQLSQDELAGLLSGLSL